MRRYACTGTRDGMTIAQKNAVLSLLDSLESEHPDESKLLIHGDCVGVDAEIAGFVTAYRWHTRARPSNIPNTRARHKSNEIYRPEDPLVRNRKIVEDGDHGLIACPSQFHEVRRSGTWATVRYARKLARRVWIIWPDGVVDYPAVQAES